MSATRTCVRAVPWAASRGPPVQLRMPSTVLTGTLAMRTHPAFHRSLAALLLALSCAAGARTASPDDVALADYLDQVARRDTLGLGAAVVADASAPEE